MASKSSIRSSERLRHPCVFVLLRSFVRIRRVGQGGLQPERRDNEQFIQPNSYPKNGPIISPTEPATAPTL